MLLTIIDESESSFQNEHQLVSKLCLIVCATETHVKNEQLK